MGMISTTGTPDRYLFALAVAGSAILLLHAVCSSSINHPHDGDDDKRDHNDELGDDSASSNDSFSSPHHRQEELPAHIQRELYKEERRKASLRFLARKKPMYDNIEMYGPDNDDVMLCTIGKKKAHWYVEKMKLAVWRTPLVEDGSSSRSGPVPPPPPSIRLLFTPKNNKSPKVTNGGAAHDDGNISSNVSHPSASKSNLYNTSHKQNICVACGTTTGLMRHYVVPYAYRRLLPKKFKSHLPHDIVLLCVECHICADQAAVERQDCILEPQYRTDPATARAVFPDPKLRHIKSCAQALWKHRQRMPPERVAEYEQVLQDYFLKERDIEAALPLSPTMLRDLAETLETDQPNPTYVPIAELVVCSLSSRDQEVADFIRSWRRFFLETLRPRYLPVGWSVENPVEKDS